MKAVMMRGIITQKRPYNDQFFLTIAEALPDGSTAEYSFGSGDLDVSALQVLTPYKLELEFSGGIWQNKQRLTLLDMKATPLNGSAPAGKS